MDAVEQVEWFGRMVGIHPVSRTKRGGLIWPYQVMPVVLRVWPGSILWRDPNEFDDGKLQVVVLNVSHVRWGRRAAVLIP